MCDFALFLAGRSAEREREGPVGLFSVISDINQNSIRQCAFKFYFNFNIDVGFFIVFSHQSI